MKVGTCWAALLVAVGICNGAAAAEPTAPFAGYAIDEKFTQKSPDGTTAIEQYVNKNTDDWTWQFGVRREGAVARLEAEPALYPANFIFTPDLKWIVRSQKIGSGTATLHLYALTPQGYARASRKPLGDRAWDYMKTRRDWRRLLKPPEYHESAHLVGGLEQNYRDLGIDWPANRYLVITLSADADVKGRKHEQTTVVNGWRCRYDLQSGKFDVPQVFAADNAKAIIPTDY